ncbi:hypothetical protein [uncultured Endozoicomonas sp.]|uniref:hypothetical protein n=1 Tax=uncultured Endozoicomonas sp. TaxID=432652 RepID=UPI00262F2270|nr:hypothetical protein [uncultured Endozoicomonas sp.]
MKKAISLSLLLLSSTYGYGDIVGAKFGGDVWETKDHGTAGSIYAQIEHPVPLLPNVALRATGFEGDKDGFNTADAYGYYEILDNSLVSVDLGAGLHRIDGSDHYDATLPMVIADLELLPNNDLSFYARASYGRGSDDTVKDVAAGARVELFPAVYLQAGYRQYTVETDGSHAQSDKIKGFTAGVHLDI